jgi:hypothetical protein
MAVVLATLPFLALGLATGRVSVLIVPPLVWTIFFSGLAAGWWGSGVGDGWIAAFLQVTIASMIAAGVGVFLRRTITRSQSM